MNPKLVPLDEITSALDLELVQEVLQTMKTIAGDGATLLIVTHEMRFARDVSHRVVFMEKGRIAEAGRLRKFSTARALSNSSARRVTDGYGDRRPL